MTASLRKPKRKLQRRSINMIRDVFSPKMYFEFLTSYSLGQCISYLEREQQLSLLRSYGPFVQTASSQNVESDIVTFFLPVTFGVGRKAHGIIISGSLEGLNDGSTVLRGEVTNNAFQLYTVAGLWGLILGLIAYLWGNNLSSGIFVLVLILIAVGMVNWADKRRGVRYIQSMFAPLNEFDSLI